MKTPNARQATWPQNLANTRPGVENLGDDMAVNPSPATRDDNEMKRIPAKGSIANVPEMAKGGRVIKVAGKKRGKDDGLVAVQKGEHVIRKAAAQKYGAAKMAAVNKGAARVEMPRQTGRAPALSASNQKRGR